MIALFLILLCVSCKNTPFEPLPQPVIHHFYILPEEINLGDRATLNWSVSYAETIMVQQDVTPTWIIDLSTMASGSYPIYPEETCTYTLYITNTQGYQTAVGSIIVNK